MSEIFISYAFEDRERALVLAEALSARGWSVWWDRKIPLGKSFDEVIEKALAEAKCVIVLWSAASVVSEWVRNEASEARRREILVPVFIEPVDAPLAFRLLNGANLSDWDPASSHPEFDQLTERIADLLGQSHPLEKVISPEHGSYASTSARHRAVNHWFRSPIAVTVLTLVVVGAALAGYFFRGGETPHPSIQNSSSSDNTPNTVDSLPSVGATDMEKRIKDLTGMLGGAIPATSIAKGFYVPGLGVRIAYLTPEQSASMLGAIPPGAVVMEIESGRPMARAGLQVGDLVLSIGGKKIAGENDLRQAIFKIGPGKTEYSYRRGDDTKTLMIDCPSCKVE